MPRPIHFEISAKNPDKLAAFYRTVFDWTINKWEGPTDYWLVGTGETGTPGIDGAIFHPDGLFTGTVNTIDVPDLDTYVAKVKANGGQMVGEKQYIPGIGHFCYMKDVEGNLLGLMQSDPPQGQQ